MGAAVLRTGPGPGSVETLTRHLVQGEDLVRCAAARALGALDDSTAAPALVDALLDEDPDVRADAMSALVTCARPEDADAVRRSLLGDPVKEVKEAAIAVLTHLRDRNSLPLLRSLAKDRSAHDVAWEDGIGLWDDWLDVQVAAITALGTLQDEAAVEVLLEARGDELGQDLDFAVFAALAQMPQGGLPALMSFLHDHDSRLRERALRALCKASPTHLEALTELLVRDANPAVRVLALSALTAASPALQGLALQDPAADVRSAALARFGSERSDLLLAALGDQNEAVRATALEALMDCKPLPVVPDLAANLEVWALTAGLKLAGRSIAFLPRLVPKEAVRVSLALAEDEERPQEVRLEALRNLPEGALSQEDALRLKPLLLDPARQIRAAALAVLARLTKAGDGTMAEDSRALLATVIGGRLEGAAQATTETGPLSTDDLGASKVESSGSHSLRINAEGEIEPATPLPEDGKSEDGDSNVIQGAFPTSTLDAIAHRAVLREPEGEDGQDVGADDEGAEVVPFHQASRKKRRRVAVDGPDDIALDLRVVALQVAAEVPGDAVEAALHDVLDQDEQPLRRGAFAAFAKRSQAQDFSAPILTKLEAALGDADPVIRGHAAEALAKQDDCPESALEPLCLDLDAIVRANVVKALAAKRPDIAVSALEDSVLLVRRAALDALLSCQEKDQRSAGFGILLNCGWSDSLGEAVAKSPEAEGFVLATLERDDLSRRQTCCALDALSAISARR